MTDDSTFSPDQFPSGCLVTTGGMGHSERKIIFASRYFSRLLGQDADSLIDMPLSHLLTPASVIIFDSYMIPMLARQGHCEEILLEIKSATGDRIPVVANAEVDNSDEGLVFWTLINASQRNRLHQDLVDARRQLEERSVVLHERSITDKLTGLLNRWELERQAGRIIDQAERNKSSVAIVMLDLDHFKRLNDELGHSAGDDALKELGQILQSEARSYDVAGRYGGDEFVLVLPDTDKAQAKALCDRLHTRLGKIRIWDEPVAASMGVVVADGGQLESGSFPSLLDHADRAMYRAKTEGRNRTMFSDD